MIANRVRVAPLALLALSAAGILAPPASAAPDPSFALGPGGPATQPETAIVSVNQVCVGDFNADGNADAAAGYRSSSTPRVGYALGDGAGALGAWTTISTASGASSCAIADFNGDGRDDVAIAGDAQSNVKIALASGAGFALGPDAVAAGPVASIAVGDTNGDGRADLVAAITRGENAGGEVQALLGDGAGGFTATTAASSGGDRPYRLVVADLNGDGRDDAVANNFGTSGVSGSGGLTTLLAQASGALAQQSHVELAVEDIAAGDINRDGRMDVAGAEAGFLRVLLGDGSGNLVVDPTNYPSTASFTIGGIELGDFNGDGALDAILGDQSTGRTVARLFSLSGTGSANPPFFSGTLGGPFVLDPDTAGSRVRTVASADFDNDSHLDLIAGTFPSPGEIGTMLNTTPIAPSSASPPGISGVARPGSTLTCSPGRWTGKPQLSYEWLRNGAPIAGETGTTYVVREQDVGSQIACRVTATNNGGSRQATSASVVAVAEQAAPANRQPPTVVGEPQFGETLACAAGGWTAGGEFSYRWLRDGEPIAAAEQAGYRVGKDDIGRSLACRVTVTNPAGTGVATSSALSAKGCLVADVAGKRRKAAKRKLAAAGCRAGKVVERRSADVRPGRVIRTKPRRGEAGPVGMAVKLIVAKRR